MSARTIGREMETLTKNTIEMLKSKGSALAKAGKIALQADHVSLNRATGEEGNSFLAIIITIRNSNFEMVPFPLCFEPAKAKTFSAFRNDLRRILKVNFVLKNDSILPELKIAETSVELKIAEISAEFKIAEISTKLKIAEISAEFKIAEISAEFKIAEISTELKIAEISKIINYYFSNSVFGNRSIEDFCH